MRLAERALLALPLGACVGEWLAPSPWGWGAAAATVLVALRPRGLAILAVMGAAAFAAVPLHLANHHVVATLLAGSVALRDDDPADRRSLYAVLMGLATVQKLLSPSFVNGSFFAGLSLQGGLLWPLAPAYPEVARALAHNRELVDGAMLEPVVLLAPPGLGEVALVAAWGVIGVEAVLCGLAWRDHRAFPWLASAFVGLLPFVRFEPVFTAVLAALTALCLPSGRWRWALLGWGALWSLLALALHGR